MAGEVERELAAASKGSGSILAMRRVVQAIPHPTRGEDLTEAAVLDIESRRATLQESVSMVHRTLGRFHNLPNVHEPLPWKQQITVRTPVSPVLASSAVPLHVCVHASLRRCTSATQQLVRWTGAHLGKGAWDGRPCLFWPLLQAHNRKQHSGLAHIRHGRIASS